MNVIVLYMCGRYSRDWFITSPIQLFVHAQIVDLALYHMCILADYGHLPLIVPDGEQFVSMSKHIRCIPHVLFLALSVNLTSV